MCRKIVLTGLLLSTLTSLVMSQGISVAKLSFCKKNISEIAPAFNDTLLYYSSRSNVKWGVKSTDQDNLNFYNLFTVHQRQDSSWTKAEQFMPEYFSEFHTSTIAFLPDSGKVFFTEVHYKDRKRAKNADENLHGVYEASITNKGYSRAKNLPFNSKRSYNTGHPTISPDGKYLFFSSDKEGGYGNVDIYVSQKVNGEWSEATNLGKKINTEGNELFPFYHKSGKLYFSTDGHGGKGGLDLFYTMLTPDGWLEPTPLEEPINTPDDEFSCYIAEDGQSGYFASNREGDDDLYEFVSLFPSFNMVNKQKENTFKYRFYDRMNGKGDGPLKYVWHFGDGQTAEGDTVIHQYRQTGTYHVQSVLVDTIENVELFILNDFQQEVKKKIQVYITSPNTVKVGELQTLHALESNLGEFKPNGYYWELPDGSKQVGETIQYIFRTKGKHIVKCGTISMDDPNDKMCTYKEITVIE